MLMTGHLRTQVFFLRWQCAQELTGLDVFELGGAEYALAALASNDAHIRAAAGTVLSHVESALDEAQRLAGSDQAKLVLEVVRNTIPADSWPPRLLPVPVAQWAVAALSAAARPEHPLFRRVIRLTLKRPSLSLRVRVGALSVALGCPRVVTRY